MLFTGTWQFYIIFYWLIIKTFYGFFFNIWYLIARNLRNFSIYWSNQFFFVTGTLLFCLHNLWFYCRFFNIFPINLLFHSIHLFHYSFKLLLILIHQLSCKRVISLTVSLKFLYYIASIWACQHIFVFF